MKLVTATSRLGLTTAVVVVAGFAVVDLLLFNDPSVAVANHFQYFNYYVSALCFEIANFFDFFVLQIYDLQSLPALCLHLLSISRHCLAAEFSHSLTIFKSSSSQLVQVADDAIYAPLQCLG